MPPFVGYILAGVIVVVLALAYLAARFPHIHWLQLFRVTRPYDPERDRQLDTAWMPEKERWREELKHRKAESAKKSPFREMLAAFPQLPPEQKRKMRRRSNVIAGLELIVLGIALPFGYHMFSMMMFFHPVSRAENIGLVTVAAAFVILGITAIARSGTSRD